MRQKTSVQSFNNNDFNTDMNNATLKTKVILWEIQSWWFPKLTEKRECIPVGCVPSAAVAMSGGGCLPKGVSARGCLPGRCLPGGGVSAKGRWGVYSPRLWTEFLTHACVNITFPQLLLQTVMKNNLTIIGTLFTVLTRYASFKNMCVQDSTSIPGANDMFNIIRIKRIFCTAIQKTFSDVPHSKISTARNFLNAICNCFSRAIEFQVILLL